MAVAPTVRFVDSITSSPTVRLNLNDQTIWSVSPETTWGMPPMRRSVSSSMLRDGEHIGATSYGNREIELVADLYPLGATQDTAALQVQNLARELDRPGNYLQYTPGGLTNPVFFRTFRTSPDSIRFDPYRRQVKVTIPAAPFALGLRQDLAAITVRNDPTLTNGLFADLTGIRGDVETPLFLEYADGAGGLARPGFAVGVRSGPAPYPTLFQQAEASTVQIDTTVVADAAASGGSKARVAFSFIPTDMQARLSTNFPRLTNPAGAENWGTFRVFARVAQTVATDVVSLAIGPGTNGVNPGIVMNRSVTIKSQTQPQLVDLGTLDSTAGLSPVGGYAAAEYRIEVQNQLWVYAARRSGTGQLDIDYLVFVPADECFGAWRGFYDDVPASSYLGVVDGPNESVYIATALTGATPGRTGLDTTSVFGRFPHVMPGSNRLVIVEIARLTNLPTPTANALSTSISLTCRYWPRYLLVRPLST